ncbi:helix-turn-helix domain-containing protein [Corynebacterium sp. HMSC078H07]|uniref:helix-turn-helix transcriptional regulator n=1 Tax=Corynebacterium sp. HMSC078H07 TaxID=1739379 RepID=UPI001AEF40EA
MEKLSDVAVFQEEAAEILGVSVRTMEAWRQCNEGPTYIHIGRRVRYRISDLEA